MISCERPVYKYVPPNQDAHYHLTPQLFPVLSTWIYRSKQHGKTSTTL